MRTDPIAAAPIIALYADLKSHAPLYVAATLFLVTSALMLLLPIEVGLVPHDLRGSTH